MASASITIRAVQALASGDVLWDGGHKEAVRGFGVRRQRDQATYVLKCRVFGRQRFFTIGPHGSPWTPEKARREAKRLLGLVADGKDPADTKVEASLQAADTLRKITDQYLEVAKRKQRPRTHSEVTRYLLTAWKPLHSLSVFKISRRHIAARVADIATEQGAVSAARARTALSTMFNWAIREGLDIAANPVHGTNRPAQPKSRDRVLSYPELGEIWQACGDDDYGRILRLLIPPLSGVMKSVGCSGRSWIPRPSDGSYRALGPKTIVSMYCRSYPLPWSCYLPGGLIATTFLATALAERAINLEGSPAGPNRRQRLMFLFLQRGRR